MARLSYGTLVLVVSLGASTAHAQTTIDVASTVAVPAVKRFGMQMSDHLYYDRLTLKNLVWHNAGFEGLRYQTVIRCASGTPAGCVDDNPSTQWPTGFMDGASYEFILGAAKGRSGRVASFTTAPRDNVTGSTYVFADSGVTPAEGDYFVVKKYFPGGADTGWNPVANGGSTITSENSDLPPGTAGRQCIRLSAASAGQIASITTAFGSFGNQTFVILNGAFRATFKAKGAGGANSVTLIVARNSNQFVNRTVSLTSSWATYTVDFTAAETGMPQGFAALGFTATGSAVLIDDVSLEQTNTDPTNTTAFRDPVIAALRTYNPGLLRSPNKEQGESLENMIGEPFAHIRSGYTVYGTSTGIEQYGWQEFLGLCELLHTEPYIVIPITFSNTEVANLMEWLGGAATTTYGARRAARGHPAPWTDSFSRIHLEYANEAWNSLFRGATMFAADFGARGNDVFGVVRQSPYYSASKFNLVLGVQTVNWFNTRATHNASANHDMLAIAPYMATRIDDYESDERLFGGLFAEASWWSRSTDGPIRNTASFINGTSRPVPLAVYEVNLHTTQGSIPQSTLDAFAPSLGAGLAVADEMLIMLHDFAIRDQSLFALEGYRYDREDGKTVLIWGVTRDIGVTDRKRPQYLAAQLINEAIGAGGDMIETSHSGDNPKWSQPLTNRIAMNDVPYLQSFAFVNGSRKGLIVFNFHRTSALQVRFGGINAPSGVVTMRRLTSGAITDNNEDRETIAIQTANFTAFDPAQMMTLPPFSMTVLYTGSSSAPAPALPTIAVDRRALAFGAVTAAGTFASSTPAQTIRLSQSGTGTVTWTATSNQPWLSVTPASGTGAAALSVSVRFDASLPASGSAAATIALSLGGAGNIVAPVNVTLALTPSASSVPFGSLDTPAGDATVLEGSVAVTGWALDNVAVKRVELWRDLQTGETTPPFGSTPADPRNGKVFIATATFVDGARPDVEALYSTMPLSYRAGWGYLMLTWGLWNQGNGTYRLHAIAVDQEDNFVSIGSKTIIVNNAAATRPFGSIDTPGIGGDAGSSPNFGWALTPLVNGAATCRVRSNGVQVSIDSGPLQPVIYGDARTDVAGAFPGYSNSAAAGGHFLFDWTTLSNGVHTIGWLVTDDCNRVDGVGSRFFVVTTGTNLVVAADRLKAEPTFSAASAFRRNDDASALVITRGYDGPSELTTARTIEVKQGERVQVRLPHGYDTAFQLVAGQDRALPIGAAWDAAAGTLTWQPAPAFIGRYRLVFTNGSDRINVRVIVVP